MPTVGDLRKTLAENQARWTVRADLRDDEEIPRHSLGASLEKWLPASQASPIEFEKLFVIRPNNPFILQRRLERKLVKESLVPKRQRLGSGPVLEAGEGVELFGGGAPASVDWRSRWGWPWITTIRDQDGCEACWCFAAVALVEAMVRVEHCVWPSISEGDVHKGMGSHCCDCGGSDNALNWIRDHGAADPGCFAWPVTASGCSGCGGTGGTPYDSIAYTPTADRSGRSVRIPDFSWVGSVSDQKTWLDTVGPLICGFDVYEDFGGVGAGIYHKQAMIGGHPNQLLGGHLMLVVGYDDTNNCWIVKNSWATTFGVNGYCRIGYGEANIDYYTKIGLQGSNPDPWTKRRMHNGGMFESGNGAGHRNFEMLTTAPGHQFHHWWRDNSVAGTPWNSGVTLGNDCAGMPTFISTTFNRNFECVYRTTSNRLHHWWFEQPSGGWHDGGVFGPTDATGVPSFIQSNYNAPGNFEVVVRCADGRLNHWWRDGGGWHDGGRFGSNIANSGATLLQGPYGAIGNFELVAVTDSGQMQHWWRDNDHGRVWVSTPPFGSGVSGPPCMIEGQFGMSDERGIGNFELCVAVGGRVEHWWRANYSDRLWRRSAVFGSNVQAVVSLVEGSYGFNLELVVLRTDGNLQHYWRAGGTWYTGVVIGPA